MVASAFQHCFGPSNGDNHNLVQLWPQTWPHCSIHFDHSLMALWEKKTFRSWPTQRRHRTDWQALDTRSRPPHPRRPQWEWRDCGGTWVHLSPMNWTRTRTRTARLQLANLTILYGILTKRASSKCSKIFGPLKARLNVFIFFLSLFLACLLAKLKRSDADDH